MGLYFKLLGGPKLTGADGNVVRLPTRKSEAILAYLAERRYEATSREALAAMLWPYSAEEQARASLRQEISVLRKALGTEFADIILAQGDRIELSVAGLDLDIWRIRDTPPKDRTPKTILPLLELYSTPFLDAFRIRSQPFSDWVWTTSQAIETEVLGLGQDALRLSIQAQDFENTQKIARHLCRIEPTYEPAHRALIEHHLYAGDDAAARRQLQQCETALRAKLDVDVSDETLQLFDTIKPPVNTAPKAGQGLDRSSEVPVQQRRFITALSVLANLESDDPEDFDSVAADVTTQIQSCIEENGGTVLRVSGDHVLACFGYPVSHDTDPDTATFAALAVLQKLKSREGGAPDCRIGLSYGQALITASPDGSSTDLKVSGPVFRAAEAVPYLGRPATVLVDQKLREVLSPKVMLAEIAGERLAMQAQSRYEISHLATQYLAPRKTDPMMGRDAQCDHFVALLNQAKLGQGSAAAILGDPGEGKSRLVQDITDRAIALGFECEAFQGNRSHIKSAFAPILDYAFRSGSLDAKRATLSDIELWLTSIDPEFALAAPYFASLLVKMGVDSPDQIAVPASAKEAVLNVFSSLASRRGQGRPLCLIFEDIQWFDATTLVAISRLVEVVSQAPVLVVMVSRKNEAPDIVSHPFVQRVELAPLQPQIAEQLLRHLLKGVSVSATMRKDVLARAEGNPLVIEEFAKSIIHRKSTVESANLAFDPIAPLGVSETAIETPDRLLPLLLSRIDCVPGAIQTLQFASVFGRQFSASQLAHVMSSIGNWAPLAVDLEEAGIIFASTRGSDTSYIFTHALIGEAIYATIPKRERPAMHLAAGRCLMLAKRSAKHSEIAQHFRTAKAYGDAADYFEKSGDQAARVFAHIEAISEYREALSMLEGSSVTEERLRQELTLNRKVAAQLISLNGIPTPAVSPFYANAQRLSAQLGDTEEIANATWGLWSSYLIVADLDKSLETATALPGILNISSSPVTRLICEYMLGVTHAYLGNMQQAADHLEDVLALYSDDLRDPLQMRFGMDIGLTANSFLGWVYALLARPQDADAASQRALQIAQTNESGLSRVFANVFMATKCLFQDQLKEAKHHAELALKGADAIGFKQWSAQARMQLARIADLSGEADALNALKKAREDYLSAGMVLARPYVDVWVASAQNRRGQFEDALETIDALQVFTDATGEKYYEFAAHATRATSLQLMSETLVACTPSDVALA